MKTWKSHLIKIGVLIALPLLYAEFSAINIKQATASNVPGANACEGESVIANTDHDHPGYMILKNGVKLQYVNGISVYQSHSELQGGLILERFPVGAIARYVGYSNGDVCVPKVLTIEKRCIY